MIETHALMQDPECLLEDRREKIGVASVVPAINNKLAQHYHDLTFISYKDVPFTKIDLPNPSEIGIDRLLSAYAAWKQVQSTVLIVDAGTAITCCVVNHVGVYLGGVIFPGLGISSKALNDYTAKIPYIHVKKQKSLVGKTTTEAVESGLYNGYKAALNGLISQYREQFKNIVVYGTGNSLSVFNNQLEIDRFDETLLFKGLELVMTNKTKRSAPQNTSR